MDDRKKIVLGSKDFLAKGVDDIFININLQQTFNQIKKEKYDNNFDLAEQFRKERNQSRNFRIYGIIDSTFMDNDNTTIYVYKDSGLTQQYSAITSTPLVYDEKNVFSKKRGKYILELDYYDSDVVYMQIRGDNFKYADQVFEQKLVYYNLDGEFVEYGTETVDIGFNNSGFLNIENNFPFFYNKHWIKKDIEIVETKQTVTQFKDKTSSVQEGNSIGIDIIMDKPSPFGNESVVLDATIGTILPADFSLSISGTPITFPLTLNWNQGEQNKTITFDAINDDIIEFSETMYFSLSNFQYTTTGKTLEHYATIEDATPRNKTIYNLGEVYKNRLSFTGRTANYGTGGDFQTSAYSILRNGLKFGLKNEEFYPSDTYKITIFNKGSDTLLPINPTLGITEEELFPTGSFKVFNVNIAYTGNLKHKIKLIFTANTNNAGTIKINGFDMRTTYLNFNWISPRITGGGGDWFDFYGYEKDFIAVKEASSAITISSTTPGLPVKLDVIGNSSNFYIEEIDPFIEYSQVPKPIELYANFGPINSLYNIQLSKNGYSGINIPENAKPASLSGENVYLISNLSNVSRGWDSVNNTCLTFTGATPSVGGPWTDVPTGTGIPNTAPYNGILNYYWPVGSAYINGFVFFSKNQLYEGQINFSSTNTADFLLNPLLTIPCTSEEYLSTPIAQKTKVTFPSLQIGNYTLNQLYVNNANSFRSFDFRTGTTGPFTTFYKSNPGFDSSNNITWGGWIYASGATTGSNMLSKFLDYGITLGQEGPLLGLDISSGAHLYQSHTTNSFILESKVPGVPFEITNTIDAYVRTSAVNTLLQYVVAGDIVGGPITVEEIVPNGLPGINLNPANNWMGGFNTTLQFVL